MKERILITGGSGFVAYHVITEALKRELEVYVSVRPSSSTDHLKGLNITFINVSFADVDAIGKELKSYQFNYIIHAAGSTKAESPDQYNLVNAVYTVNLAQAANDANIPLKKFVFISSLAALGPCAYGSFITESTKPAPVTDYGRSKKLAEEKIEAIKGLPLIVLRPTAVFGPREKDLFILFKTINGGLAVTIGAAPQHLSFIYVTDLAKLMLDALNSSITGSAYNVSDGSVYERQQLSAYVKAILRKKVIDLTLPITVVKAMATLMENVGKINGKTPVLNHQKIHELTGSWACSIDKAKQELGFQPAYDLKQGLTETIKWYKDNNWL